MKEIIVSTIVSTIVTAIIARVILPKIKFIVKLIIKIFVTTVEKKVQGSGMGAIKKAKVMKKLRWFGIHATKEVDEFINTLVDEMNSKGNEIKESVVSDVGDKVVHNIEKNVKKVVK